MTKLTREMLRSLLLQWQERMLSASKVRVEAEVLDDKFVDEWPSDYEESIPEHIALRVLSKLDMLLFDLVTEKDIPFLLTFLDTPEGAEKEAMQKWDAYFTHELYRQRAEELLKDEEGEKGYSLGIYKRDREIE